MAGCLGIDSPEADLDTVLSINGLRSAQKLAGYHKQLADLNMVSIPPSWHILLTPSLLIYTARAEYFKQANSLQMCNLGVKFMLQVHRGHIGVDPGLPTPLCLV